MVSTATAATTLDAEAFNQLVLEKSLQTWKQGQYIYTGYHGSTGWEIYRTAAAYRHIWTYAQVCTQDNVAGGNLNVTITPAEGSPIMNPVGLLTASGNRAVYIQLRNVDTTTVTDISVIGAVAGAKATFSPVAGASTSSNAAQSIRDLPIGEGAYFLGQVTAAAQTETATLSVVCEVLGNAVAPTVSWASSAGTPNAAAATENTVATVMV